MSSVRAVTRTQAAVGWVAREQERGQLSQYLTPFIHWFDMLIGWLQFGHTTDPISDLKDVSCAKRKPSEVRIYYLAPVAVQISYRHAVRCSFARASQHISRV